MASKKVGRLPPAFSSNGESLNLIPSTSTIGKLFTMSPAFKLFFPTNCLFHFFKFGNGDKLKRSALKGISFGVYAVLVFA